MRKEERFKNQLSTFLHQETERDEQIMFKVRIKK